jgi:hypothetical protein
MQALFDGKRLRMLRRAVVSELIADIAALRRLGIIHEVVCRHRLLIPPLHQAALEVIEQDND